MGPPAAGNGRRRPRKMGGSSSSELGGVPGEVGWLEWEVVVSGSDGRQAGDLGWPVPPPGFELWWFAVSAVMFWNAGFVVIVFDESSSVVSIKSAIQMSRHPLSCRFAAAAAAEGLRRPAPAQLQCSRIFLFLYQ